MPESRSTNSRANDRAGSGAQVRADERSGGLAPVVGLTGGIAAGKSSVSQYLVGKSAYLIDADSVGHRLIAPDGAGYDAVIEAFGQEIVAAGGAIDRRKLGDIVFSDPAQLQRLNDISHPGMARAMAGEIARVRASDSPPPAILLDAALLYEAKWDGLCDRVWAVTSTRETAIERLMARNQLSREQALSRLDAQMDPAQKASRADTVIANDGSLEALYRKVDPLWEALLALTNARES